ncbi:MAG TPA: hypothetical protein DCP28_32650 [Cytophagales bacterium]|nr:hypothetical protein [Cytophagales bacterium]
MATATVDTLEKQKVVWLRVHAFATQPFIAIYFSVANAMLVHYFDSSQLPLAYLASGVVGFLLGALYKQLIGKIPRGRVFGGTLIVIGILAILLTISGIIAGAGGESEGTSVQKAVAFGVFIFASPFITLVGLESGGLSLSLLDLRQTKRLQARINMGATVASIIGCFLMAGLVPKVFSNTLYMNFIALAGIVGAVASLVVIQRKFELKEAKKAPASSSKNSPDKGTFMKQKYTAFLGITAFVSMVAFYMADFLYLSSIPHQEWLKEPSQKAQFIAIAFGVIKTGELILGYLSGSILSRFGLRVGLLLLPVGLLIFMLSSSVVGFYGGITETLPTLTYIGEDPFSLFFALVLLVKFTERTVRKSIDDPAFRTLYQPLPAAKRLTVQSIVEGRFKQGAIMLSGLLLLALGHILPKDETNHILPYYLAAVGIPILIGHFLLARQLYGLYRNKLTSYLRKGGGWRMIQDALFGFDILRDHAKAQHKSEFRTISLRVMEAIQPGSGVKELPHLLAGKKKDQDLGLQLLAHTYESGPEIREPLTKMVETSKSKVHQVKAKAFLNKYQNYDEVDPNRDSVFRLSLQEKESLLRHWYQTPDPPRPEVVLRLLKDPDRRVRSGAVRLAGKYPDGMYKYPLLELLENPEFASVAATALGKFGGDILQDLEALFYRKNDHRFKLKILRIYRHIKEAKASEIIFDYLSYPDREIQMEALKSLNYLQYTASGDRLVQVRQRIEERVEYLVWLSAKEYGLQNGVGADDLREGLHQEGEVNREIILMLLGLHYGHSKLALIRRNLQDQNQLTNRIFALELIENLLEDEDKVRLMPLFESKRPVHQIRYFKNRYPQAKRDYVANLKDIIIHTQANTGLWIKAHAVQLLGPLVQELPHEIATCLYHPHPLVSQTAAEVIARDFPEDWPRMLSKLPKEKARYLFELVDEDSDPDQLIYHKVELMMKVPLFRDVPPFRLLDLADAFSVRRFAPHEELHFSRMKDREVVCIVLDGALEAYRKDDAYFWFSKHQVFIQDIIPDSPTVKLASRRGATVLIVDREHFFDLAIHQSPLIEALLEGIHATSEKEYEMENILSLIRKK